jgi:hypothetical protein
VIDGTTIFDHLPPIDSSPLALDATPPAAIRPTVSQTATAAANPTDINRSAPPEIQSSVLSPEQQVITLTPLPYCSQCCGSGMFIPGSKIFFIMDPGSEFFPSRIRIKEFKYFNLTQKNCFLALGNMIRILHPGSGS